MLVDAKIATLLAIMLVTVRFSVVFLLSPLFSMGRLPVKFRLIFILALSFILVAANGAGDTIHVTTLGTMAEAVLFELLLGGLLSFGIFTAFAAFQLGGRIVDLQMGFGVAGLIDPSTNTQAPLIGTVLNLMGVLTFFLLDGHHLVLRGLVYSLEKVPPGIGLEGINIQALVAQFGVMFVLGFALVAPVIVTLVLLDIAMAIAARTMPQVNIFIISFPIKIFIGLSVLALSLGYMSPMLEKIYASIFDYWELILG
ncbi:MAG: flagellar biosynthetic protein FliR [Candidatus Sedimenticola sp. (ex Thyasira tokunagai)]